MAVLPSSCCASKAAVGRGVLCPRGPVLAHGGKAIGRDGIGRFDHGELAKAARCRVSVRRDMWPWLPFTGTVAAVHAVEDAAGELVLSAVLMPARLAKHIVDVGVLQEQSASSATAV